MVIAMFNESDPELSRLFAQARAALADEPFIAQVMSRIERARRTRLWLGIFAIAAVLIVLSLNARLVMDQTAWVVSAVGDFPPANADLFSTPWGWAVSMVVGVWVMLRTRPSRR